MANTNGRKNRQLSLLVTLRHVEPPIWRRVLVDSGITLVGLHRVLQCVMQWEGYHLHEFEIDGVRYAPPADEDWGVPAKSERKKLSTILRKSGSAILYRYDYGDDWEVDVVLESTFDVDGQIPKATCTAGERAGPIEDSGGPGGYLWKLEVMADPNHPDHDEISEWMPFGFDSELVDFRSINGDLSEI